MRKSAIFFVIILFALAGCRDKQISTTEMPWFKGTFAKAQDRAGDNNVMLFFKTEW